MTYSLSFPAKTRFGEGVFDELPELLPQTGNVLIVGGQHAAGLAEQLAKKLPGRKTAVAVGITPELPLAEVDKLLSLGREIEAAAVVAIGGGSVLDAGKTAAALLPLPGETADYFYGKRAIPGKGAFFAAVPTTAGTGSEATPNAVLTDPATKKKQSIRHETMLPDLALVDPMLTYGTPPAVTAASGFDALTQAIESGISSRANAFSRSLAVQAFRSIFFALPAAMDDSRTARRLLAEGSMMTGLAFAQSGLGAVHGIGHPVGSLLNIPHGVTCAVLLPAVLRFNREKVKDFAEAAGWPADPEVLIGELENLRRQLDLPENLRAAGLREAHYPFIVENCRSGSMKSNPVPMSDADVAAILKELS